MIGAGAQEYTQSRPLRCGNDLPAKPAGIDNDLPAKPAGVDFGKIGEPVGIVCPECHAVRDAYDAAAVQVAQDAADMDR